MRLKEIAKELGDIKKKLVKFRSDIKKDLKRIDTPKEIEDKYKKKYPKKKGDKSDDLLF